jgi:hypothetical protein
VYHYHGLEDELVPLNQDVNLHYAWRNPGVKDDFQLYNGEHLFTDAMGAPNALKWIEERVAGKTAPTTCGQHKSGATLPANARLTPDVGDLIVKLNEWSLTGKLPLTISEPTNALASGSFAFKTTVTVPPFGGCGVLGPVLTAAVAGPGNTVELTAKGPAPNNW